MSVITPTARQVAGRSVFWVVATVFAGLIAVALFGMVGGTAEPRSLDADSAAPSGARALARVLAEQGVTVVEADSLDEAKGGIDDPARSTLFLYDEESLLDAARLRQLATLADRIVVAAPGFAELRRLAPEIASAGAVEGELDAECGLPAAERAGRITGDGEGYRLVEPVEGAELCFGSGDEVFSVIRLDREGRSVTVLGATAALSNERVAVSGNAALALNLLGESETLVWYLPTVADVDGAPDPSALLPGWVFPVSVLLGLVAVAAAIWRGRRLGPLVTERLPVTVRASETMEGRARLYERGSARLHALDALRIGTVQRLAGRLGLGALATVDEVIDAAATATARAPAALRGLLVDDVPGGDAELVRLSDALLELEAAVTAATTP